MLFPKNEAFMYCKNSSLPRKSKVLFRFSAFKMVKKKFGALTPFQFFFTLQRLQIILAALLSLTEFIITRFMIAIDGKDITSCVLNNCCRWLQTVSLSTNK